MVRDEYFLKYLSTNILENTEQIFFWCWRGGFSSRFASFSTQIPRTIYPHPSNETTSIAHVEAHHNSIHPPLCFKCCTCWFRRWRRRRWRIRFRLRVWVRIGERCRMWWFCSPVRGGAGERNYIGGIIRHRHRINKSSDATIIQRWRHWSMRSWWKLWRRYPS